MRVSRPLLTLLLALTIGLAPRAAAADTPRAAAPPSDAEVTRRIAFIQERLDRGTAAADRWWYGWYAGWTALTVGQAALAVGTTDAGLRADSAVGAVGSSLGVIPLGLFPFPARFAAADLRALPASTPDERRRKLARAEGLLKTSAEAEVFGRSWISHTLCGTVSIALGLVLGLAYRRPLTGALNAVAGIALSEIQIFTQPTAAIDDWSEYSRSTGEAAGVRGLRVGASGLGSGVRGVTWSLAPMAGIGLGFSGAF